MLILQDQKLFESLALKRLKEKLQTPLFFDVLAKFRPQCMHRSHLCRRAYTSKGKVCLSAVQTPVMS